ncbi:MAG TPA: ABC transporter ATP-binding protein [Stellaceae bacterium]|nr:ABC transporter ATP-binding protein [Stellaceae bacterium]
MSGFIECIDVGKTYRGRTGAVEALRGISISCAEGEFVCLLGLSGCGKSTLLQMIAGLETPSTGQIIVDGRELDGPSPAASIVFQDHGLFPWMSVRTNVEFNMKARGVPAAERRERGEEMLALTGLSGFATRYPHELSGGMRQRVGIARALTTRPRALLMDEPFGALDAQTRGRLQSELLDIWAAQRTTVLFVTHSIDEAVFLADRILVFTPRPGRLSADVDVDLPRPRDPRSAGFAHIARGLRAALGTEGGSE